MGRHQFNFRTSIGSSRIVKMQFFLKSFLVFLYFLGLCQSSVLRQKRSPYLNPYDGLPVNLDGEIKWTSSKGTITTRPYTFSVRSNCLNYKISNVNKYSLTFQKDAVDKHFAPDDVIEAIENSLASVNANEREAAIVLAATQRPKPIGNKANIKDAPEVYTDASGKPRVRYSTDYAGNIKNPKINTKDMTLSDLNFANTFFKNSDFPRTLQGTTLFASGQWQDPATGTVMSQVYFKDGIKDAIQFQVSKAKKGPKSTKLTDAARLGYIEAKKEFRAFGFAGGVDKWNIPVLEFAHLAGATPAPGTAITPFPHVNAFDNCKKKIC